MERALRISEYVRPGREEFMTNRMMQDAVIRNFEVIGEAAGRISEEVKEKYRAIPWQVMKAFRNVLIHRYEGVDLSEVWEAAETNVPQLITALRAVLPPLEELESRLSGEDEPAP
jgi:uncharacterized protein with HEPN domain